jgi:hypothetical protein
MKRIASSRISTKLRYPVSDIRLIVTRWSYLGSRSIRFSLNPVSGISVIPTAYPRIPLAERGLGCSKGATSMQAPFWCPLA